MDAESSASLSRLAATVRRLRIAADLTQEAFAERCDLSTRYVQMVEGADTEPGLFALGKLAAGLGLRPSVLLRRAGL